MEVFLLTSTVVALISSGVAGLAPFISNSNENKSNQKSFLETLKNGLITKSMTYSDLQHIAEYWNQSRKSTFHGLRKMLSDATSGEKNLIDSIELIRDLLETHQKNEPFAELPENISLQLADIENQPEKNKIDQLAASLSTLYISQQRSLSKEKSFAYAGFIVGLIGIILTIAIFIYSIITIEFQ